MLKRAHLGNKVYLSTVSGVVTTKTDLIEYADKNLDGLSVITTKSFQVIPNPGNREPIICETTPDNFGNSVGLRNPGMEIALKELKDLRNRRQLRCFLNVSVSADNAEDFITLVRAFDSIADSIELNFSCPHAKAGFGSSIGSDAAIAGDYVRKIKAGVPSQRSLLIVKLTPNVNDIASIAKEVIKSGADGIAAINTVGPSIHMDKTSGKPILQNSIGGKGGCSGEWVKDRALKCVKEIRDAVGDDVIIFGMGGVSTGEDVYNMVKAGADVVGIGSVFAKVNQKKWNIYLSALKKEAEELLEHKEVTIASKDMISGKLSMEYKEHTIEKIVRHSNDIYIFTLSGKIENKAGEFVFLWIPGVGEKPFSVADSSVPVFIIKRRGPFTEALFQMKTGEKVYSRGIYGAPLENRKTENALLIAGGTGEAVLVGVAEKLSKQGTKMEFLVGTSSDKGGIMQEKLSLYGSYKAVFDDGKPGRVLDFIKIQNLDTAVYIVGPEIFMARAAEAVLAEGVDEDDIYVSMEKSTRCGIGLCGECSCGGRLTCQWGTFMNYRFLREENVL